MLFPSLTFGVFFVLVLLASWAFNPENGRRKLVLLAASYLFYGWWDWRFCGLLAASSIVNWAFGRIIGSMPRSPARAALIALAIMANLGVLAFFKYYGFFIENLADLLNALGWERDLPLLQIILPVGISFYTFQGISYIIDIKRGEADHRASLADAMLYISFFPQLVAGPIVRARDFLPQLDRSPTISRQAVALGALLILWGLFKKVVIANELASGLVDPVFFAPDLYGGVDRLFAVYGYAVQIYCDFSAYSDIAIGCAALLGYRFNRNFDQPYRARSFQEFWRRWHISLSTWLRDYLYKPLGGSRGGEVATQRNLMITMLLGGLWHGAAWTFLAWGFLHGLALAVERMLGLARSGRGLVSLFITFHGVCLAWVLFRAPDFATAWLYLTDWQSLATPIALLTPALGALVVFGLMMHALPPRGIETAARWLARLRSPAIAVLAALAFTLIDALRAPGIAPFIYFQF